MDNFITGLPPVIGKEPKVVILGSMPSIKSIEKQEYYGNTQNHFWKIMSCLFKERDLELKSYEERTSFIKDKGLCLWDTIKSCVRKGSLDQNIKNAVPNDINQLMMDNPTIRLIVCNGRKAEKILKTYFPQFEEEEEKVICLPSTSPIPGKYNKTFAEKVELWSIILKYSKNSH